MAKYSSRAIAFKRIVVSFLLGILLIGSTACSNGTISQAKSEVDYSNGKREVGLLYSKSKSVKSLDSIDDFVSPEQQEELLDPKEIPALQQPMINRADPDNRLLEKTKQMFKDASNF